MGAMLTLRLRDVSFWTLEMTSLVVFAQLEGPSCLHEKEADVLQII